MRLRVWVMVWVMVWIRVPVRVRDRIRVGIRVWVMVWVRVRLRVWVSGEMEMGAWDLLLNSALPTHLLRTFGNFAVKKSRNARPSPGTRHEIDRTEGKRKGAIDGMEGKYLWRIALVQRVSTCILLV